MLYQTPSINEMSLHVQQSNFVSGKDTASCCTGSCCYGASDSSCSFFF